MTLKLPRFYIILVKQNIEAICNLQVALSTGQGIPEALTVFIERAKNLGLVREYLITWHGEGPLTLVQILVTPFERVQ